MNIDSKILNGAATLIKGWHPVDPEGYSPYEFTSEKEELNAARETAWIGVYLMLTGRVEIKGKDGAEALNRLCVNRDFNKLKIGGSRHALICNEKGQIASSGIVTRMEENLFRTYAIFPNVMEILGYGLDVQAEYIPDYFIQIDGPKSLEILEEASQTDLHDIKFGQNKMIKIAGTEVFIHRLGMSGALAYEIHGDVENSDAIYDAVVKAGEMYGAVRQGIKTYPLNHTPGGYPNQFLHFGYPDENGNMFFNMPISGSASDNLDNYFVTPYDVGWGNLVNFDHEFTGKEALLKLREINKVVPVTLEWDLNDVMDQYNSEFLETNVDADEGILDYSYHLPEWKRVHMDYIVVDGNKIGLTSGRVKDYYHKKFLSMGFIDAEYAKEGYEVSVMWGKPGKPQKAIRAKVARFPYYNGKYRNETFNVDEIPRRKFE